MLRRLRSTTPVATTPVALLFVAACFPLACNLITGIGDYRACEGEGCGTGGSGAGITTGGTAGAGGTAGTGGAPATDDLVDCSMDGWCAVSPGHTFHDLNGAWGDPESGEIWAVGAEGRILRNKGGVWERVSVPTKSAMRAVSGTGPSDVWVGGDGPTLLHYDGSEWSPTGDLDGGTRISSVWSAPSGEVWATTDTSHVYRVKGGSATKIETDVAFESVSGTADDDVWFAGGSAPQNVARWDGQAITTVDGLPGSPPTYHAVRGESTGVVWLGGQGLQTARNDGSGWQLFQLPSACCLQTTHAFWGTGDTLWAVGDYFAVFRWGGADWSLEPAPPMLYNLRSVAGRSPSDVWFVGAYGQMIHFDGSTYTSDLLTTDKVTGVWGSSPDDVWIITDGADGVHWDGEQWLHFPVGSEPFAAPVAVGGSGPTDVWVTYSNGATRHWQGAGWSKHSWCGPLGEVTSVIAFPDGKAWVAGNGGVVCQWDGTAWKQEDSGTGDKLHALWGDSPDALWAFGDNGTVLRRDATGWTKDATYSGTDSFRAAWGAEPDDIHAVTSTGAVLHFDGTAWSAAGKVPFACCAAEARIGGSPDGKEVWIAAFGLLSRRDPSADTKWTTELTSKKDVRSVWVTGDTAWAVGDVGLVVRKSF